MAKKKEKDLMLTEMDPLLQVGVQRMIQLALITIVQDAGGVVDIEISKIDAVVGTEMDFQIVKDKKIFRFTIKEVSK